VGSIGLPEVLVVLVVALVVLGPSRLPEAARSVGKAVAEFRRVTAGLQDEVRDTFGDLTAPFSGGDFGTTPTPAATIVPPPPLDGPELPPGAAPAGDIIPPPPEGSHVVRGTVVVDRDGDDVSFS
jgi:Tat protein translocase TatB subunit